MISLINYRLSLLTLIPKLHPLSLKDQILNKCREYVNVRIATAKQAMDNAQQSANEEGKSSAGDKYETGRAMMQMKTPQAASAACGVADASRRNLGGHRDRLRCASMMSNSGFSASS